LVQEQEERLAPLGRPDDALKQAQLDRMKRLATGLLVAATILYAAARVLEGRHAWLGVVRAMAEAAMVGGLADWFAVTALFRRPLGLPIPHTAIVASRKDRIGRTLGTFVQHNFLSREAVTRKLQTMHIAERLARWLAEPAHARAVARQVAAELARSAEAVPEGEATRLIGESLAARVRATQVAPLLGDVLSLVASDSRHQDLLDDALRLVEQAVEENRELIRLKVMEESPWWVPSVIDEQIYQKILGAIERLLHDVQEDPRHPVRAKFDLALARFIDNLKHSPETIARAEALKAEVLDRTVLDEIAASIWQGARAGLARYVTRERDGEPSALERGIVSFAESVLGNPTLLAQLEASVIDVVVGVVEQHRHEVGELIAHTVSAWDPEATARRIELAIGRDLQFIRINGTLVGGLAGLVIYVISALL
jgi:uncharacterized membrane-anchored protein YjiN (DUF445 family)